MEEIFSDKVKSFEEFNTYYQYKSCLEEMDVMADTKKKTAGQIGSSIFFYLVIAGIIIATFFYTQQNTKSAGLFGYSYYSIQTSSMVSVYPPGTLVFVKKTDPAELRVGDDITYVEKTGKVITHRIIEVYEEYEDSKLYAFSTQGVDNPTPDDYITIEDNVIGKVIGSVEYAGFVLQIIADNILYVGIGLVLIFAVAMLLKHAFKKQK